MSLTELKRTRPSASAVDPVTKRLSIASTWISLWTAMFSLGLFIGTISCTWTLDQFGPRKVTMAATVFLMAGVAVQVASETKETLLAGKVGRRPRLQGSPSGAGSLILYAAPRHTPSC
jgi:MFS family permease